MMKKIFNFRPILFIAMALIIGGYAFSVLEKFDWWIFVALGVVACSFFVAFVFLFKYKNRKICVEILSLVVIPFLIGGMVVSYFINQNKFGYSFGGTYYIEGVVKDGGVVEGNEISIMLENVSISSVTDENVIIENDNLTIYLSGYLKSDKEIYIGDKISFVGDLNANSDKTKGLLLNAKSVDGFAYNYTDITVVETGSGFKYNILRTCKDVIFEHMDEDNADVAFAMLFGKKMTMRNDLKQAYSMSGLSHVLAVSGLHVGFVIMLFGWLLGKIVKSKWVYAILLLSVLIFYSFLCDWSPSVIRAVVMCSVLLLSGGLNVQYDGLNALSIAGIVNFIIDPLNIFSIGFLLSFMVVFSIFSIAPQIMFLFKNKMPRKLASSIAVSVSAWIGSLPLLMFYFGEFSIYSVLINILIVPLVGVVFIATTICLVLAIITGLGALMLAIPNVLLAALNFLATGFGLLKGAVLNFTCSYPIMLLGVIAIFVASDYNFIKRKWLYAGTLSLCFICCSIIYGL